MERALLNARGAETVRRFWRPKSRPSAQDAAVPPGLVQITDDVTCGPLAPIFDAAGIRDLEFARPLGQSAKFDGMAWRFALHARNSRKTHAPGSDGTATSRRCDRAWWISVSRMTLILANDVRPTKRGVSFAGIANNVRAMFALTSV